MENKYIDMILPSLNSHEIYAKEIIGSHLNKLAANIVNIKVPTQTIKDSMQNTILSIVDIIDSQKLNEMSYDIDEVELGINIGIDGNVSLASILSGGINTQATIKICLKKKNI
jgi:hypothetical protein